MDNRARENNVKDKHSVVDEVIEKLFNKGFARIVNLGQFKVVPVKGRKVYNFKKRAMVPLPDYRQVTFTASTGLRDMLNKKVAINKIKSRS